MHLERSVRPITRRFPARLLTASGLSLALLGAGASRVAAQTEYYNTDRGRPVEIEDAYPTERYAFELKLAPVRLERAPGGIYSWAVEPELAYGILPRTHLELGVPFAHTDAGAERRAGLEGLDLSVLHNFNAETRTMPALGLRADVRVPVGNLAPDHTYGSVTGIATRTFPAFRVHVNGRYTVGPDPSLASADARIAEQSRWLAGVAVDRTLPLRSLLFTGEAYASQPLLSSQDVEYTVGTGVRYQWSTLLAVDAGIGRRLTGDRRAWFLTFGSAYSFAMASLMPGGAR